MNLSKGNNNLQKTYNNIKSVGGKRNERNIEKNIRSMFNRFGCRNINGSFTSNNRMVNSNRSNNNSCRLYMASLLKEVHI